MKSGDFHYQIRNVAEQRKADRNEAAAVLAFLTGCAVLLVLLMWAVAPI